MIKVFEDKFSGSWADYKIGRSQHYALTHKDTGVEITDPGNGHALESFLCAKQFAECIKTKDDVYRFIAMVQHMHPREIRTQMALSSLERHDSKDRLKLSEMIDVLVSNKNTHTGPFLVCSYNLRPELEAVYGRDWMKNLKRYSPEKPTYPEPTLEDFRIAVHKMEWNLRDHPSHIWEARSRQKNKGKAFKARKMPFVTYYLSFRNNGGEWEYLGDDRRVCVYKQFHKPPHYVRPGEHYWGYMSEWKEELTKEDIYRIVKLLPQRKFLAENIVSGEEWEHDAYYMKESRFMSTVKREGFKPAFVPATATEVSQFKAKLVLETLKNFQKTPALDGD